MFFRRFISQMQASCLFVSVVMIIKTNQGVRQSVNNNTLLTSSCFYLDRKTSVSFLHRPELSFIFCILISVRWIVILQQGKPHMMKAGIKELWQSSFSEFSRTETCCFFLLWGEKRSCSQMKMSPYTVASTQSLYPNLVAWFALYL